MGKTAKSKFSVDPHVFQPEPPVHPEHVKKLFFGREAELKRGLETAVLHETPGCDVVVTARSWYAHSRKELQTLVDLSRSSPMSSQELLGIHDRRFLIYGRRAGSKEFLNREALGTLASDVDGLPGVFLQHLNTAFYA